MRRWVSVLLWSVIAAAFIGPGTVATAAAAGARHGYSLLWALAFSTVACLVLQEAAARLTVVSGRDLGEALASTYSGPLARGILLLVVLGGIVLGCAAYEAGNILGGASGAALALEAPSWALAAAVSALAAALLWGRAPDRVARLLSGLVAAMGIGFLTTAVLLRPPLAELLRGTAIPIVPPGAGLLVLGLVGTTVVPYNLFLGSGLARGQSLGTLRFGLGVAVVLGGLISMAVLIVGASVADDLSFPAVAAVLGRRLGPWAADFFAVGLLAAGLSSAVTAPLAGAVTVRSLIGDRSRAWSDGSWRFRSVWGAVLAVGVGFGLSGVRPVPAILLAQALNGIVLPGVAVFLLLAVNDRRLMGSSGLNGRLANLAMGLVVGTTVVLGVVGVGRVVAAVAGRRPAEGWLLVVALAMTLVAAVPVARRVAAGRRLREPPGR